jgi:hypothetical protein
VIQGKNSHSVGLLPSAFDCEASILM